MDKAKSEGPAACDHGSCGSNVLFVVLMVSNAAAERES